MSPVDMRALLRRPQQPPQRNQGREQDVFLGLKGSSPQPPNRLTLRISLPNDNRMGWSGMIARVIEAGVIAFAEIESIIGRLATAQTYIFGWIGRETLGPLYTQLRSKTYNPLLSKKELATILRRAADLAHAQSRRISQIPSFPCAYCARGRSR